MEPDGLSPYSKNQLHDAGWWAKVIGIVGFAFSGLMGLIAVVFMVGGPFISTLLKTGDEGSPAKGSQPLFFGLIYLILAAFYFLMSWWVYRFGSEVQAGLKLNATESLDSSFYNLKNYFQAFGILMLIGVGFMLIGVLGVLTVSFFN